MFAILRDAWGKRDLTRELAIKGLKLHGSRPWVENIFRQRRKLGTRESGLIETFRRNISMYAVSGGLRISSLNATDTPYA